MHIIYKVAKPSKDWCWSWNSNTQATSWEELTHWKRPWCWEGLGAGGEGDNRGWDGWIASPTRWAWVWVDSGSWWWTGRPGMLQFMGSQNQTRLSDWTELNWNPQRFSQEEQEPIMTRLLTSSELLPILAHLPCLWEYGLKIEKSQNLFLPQKVFPRALQPI